MKRLLKKLYRSVEVIVLFEITRVLNMLWIWFDKALDKAVDNFLDDDESDPLENHWHEFNV